MILHRFGAILHIFLQYIHYPVLYAVRGLNRTSFFSPRTTPYTAPTPTPPPMNNHEPPVDEYKVAGVPDRLKRTQAVALLHLTRHYMRTIMTDDQWRTLADTLCVDKVTMRDIQGGGVRATAAMEKHKTVTAIANQHGLIAVVMDEQVRGNDPKLRAAMDMYVQKVLSLTKGYRYRQS